MEGVHNTLRSNEHEECQQLYLQIRNIHLNTESDTTRWDLEKNGNLTTAFLVQRIKLPWSTK